MTQAARKPDGHATRMPAIGHLPRGRLGRIVLACRDARARQGRAWTSAGLRASAFVGDLLQRHQQTRWMGPWPEQALAARTPGAMTVMQRHLHWAYAPRLFLQLAGSERAAATATPPQLASTHGHEHVMETEAPRFISRLLEQMLTRCERIDTLKVVERVAPAHERSASDARIATRPATPPTPVFDTQGRVPRVLRSDTSTSTARTRAEEHPSPHPPSAPSPDSTPHVAAMSPRGLPPINIEHLADRVVHAIDRRLTAQRERHGRLGS